MECAATKDGPRLGDMDVVERFSEAVSCQGEVVTHVQDWSEATEVAVSHRQKETPQQLPSFSGSTIEFLVPGGDWLQWPMLCSSPIRVDVSGWNSDLLCGSPRQSASFAPSPPPCSASSTTVGFRHPQELESRTRILVMRLTGVNMPQRLQEACFGQHTPIQPLLCVATLSW